MTDRHLVIRKRSWGKVECSVNMNNHARVTNGNGGGFTDKFKMAVIAYDECMYLIIHGINE